MGDDTHPSVFIIESLTLKDEREELFEGRILEKILHLSGKECRYFYIRTEREFELIAREFRQSRFRYLHLSCHANKTEIGTTFDPLSFARTAEILSPVLNRRRLFLSACQMATPSFAQLFIPHSGCFSVLGPASDVGFGDAALLWSSFYHLMFRTDADRMQRKWIRTYVKRTADVFQVAMNLYVGSDNKTGMKKYAIRPTVPED